MACSPSPLSAPDLVVFLGKHVGNDVHWFIRSIDNYERYFHDPSLPPNSVVAFLDSGLLHGRALLEFFMHSPGQKKDVRACHFRVGQCGKTQSGQHGWFDSADEKRWKTAIDQRLAHLTANRDGAPAGDVTIVNGSNYWQFRKLWEILEGRFRLLAGKTTVPGADNSLIELLDIKVPKYFQEGTDWKPRRGSA